MFVQHCQAGRYTEAQKLLQLATVSNQSLQPLFCASVDGASVTPLHAAARAQWPDAVMAFLGLCPAIANWRTFEHAKPKGWTPS